MLLPYMIKISRDLLDLAKPALLEIEATTVLDIRDVFFREGDVRYDDAFLLQEKLPYDWRDPLYMKMVHRFRNCNYLAAVFFHQIDPGNQDRFLNRRLTKKRVSIPIDHLRQLVTFMAWTSNMIGVASLIELLVKPGSIENSGTTFRKLNEKYAKEIECWNKTPIAFFYTLSPYHQGELVDQYNKEEVESREGMVTSNWVDFYPILREELERNITDLASVNVEENLEASESGEEP